MTSSTQGKIHIACPHCRKELSVAANLAGKQGKCPGCYQLFQIPKIVPLEPVGPRQPVSGLTLLAPGFGAAPSLSPLDNVGNRSMDPTGPAQSGPAAQPIWSNPQQQNSSVPNYNSPFGPVNPQSHLATDLLVKATREQKECSQGWRSGPVAGILGGIGMMIGAVVWFVVGFIMADRVFFYPPILFVLGVLAVVRGVMGVKS